jgi:hypothetical protein
MIAAGPTTIDERSLPKNFCQMYLFEGPRLLIFFPATQVFNAIRSLKPGSYLLPPTIFICPDQEMKVWHKRVTRFPA